MSGTDGLAIDRPGEGNDPSTYQFLHWYKTEARPFLERAAPERLAELDDDANRLADLLARPEHITVCFLGHSGIGKSTLLNALAAGRDQVLPAGGIGPLTAQATEVHYSEVPTFTAHYQKRQYVGRLIFALERAEERASVSPYPRPDHSSPSGELEAETLAELMEAEDDADGGKAASIGDLYRKQAMQLVTGDQFAQRPLTYAIDCLREACGYEQNWGTTIEPDDQVRVDQLRLVLSLAEHDHPYVRRADGDASRSFLAELKDHAAGFLAPMIRTFEVGWPAEVLAAGIRLVDLPGVGIAQDTFRRVTKEFIRDRARAVVLVVDRAGPTADTVDLLRTSGYWDRLVGAADDPQGDPCSLIIAVTKVDDVAAEEWRNLPPLVDRPRPKKREVYGALVKDFPERMRVQIADQLGKLGSTSNVSVTTARTAARDQILETLEIHPVSAPEYRKLLLDDEDDRAFLQTEAETGVPDLKRSLVALAQADRAHQRERIAAVADRFRQSVIGELHRLDALWRSQSQQEEEAEKLEKQLETVLAPKRKERDLRVGAFREFLDATGQTRIRELVHEAREVAEEEVAAYLNTLKDAHWATLRAAVRRGGTFYGSRAIDLPDDIAGKFQEPMAAVWSQKLLKEIRQRTTEFAKDQQSLVEEICAWADERASAATSRLVANQRRRIARSASQMDDVGKEAVSDLRKVVKQKLSDAIQKPVRRACEVFVKDGNDIGPGVKSRILFLFQQLAKESTRAAQSPANNILQSNFSAVRNDVRNAFEAWGDPIQETANLILRRHAEQLSHEDADRRLKATSEIERVLRAVPTSQQSPTQ